MTRNMMPIRVRARAIAILGAAVTVLQPRPGLGGLAERPGHEYKLGWDDQRVADETIKVMGLPAGDTTCTRRHIKYMREEIYGKMAAKPLPEPEAMAARLAAMDEVIQTLRHEVDAAREYNRYFARQVNNLVGRLGEGPLVELPPEPGS